MADYYPLIARAIAGLDPSAPGESRRALYERARSALIANGFVAVAITDDTMPND